MRPNTSRGFQGKICKQTFGKFCFSSPRADMEMRITLSESYEFTGFYRMSMMKFGVLLKIWVLIPPSSTMLFLGFICQNKCRIQDDCNGTLLPSNWAPQVGHVADHYPATAVDLIL